MTTISHEPTRARRWPDILVPEMWASLAIAVIWLSVLFDSVFGPDFTSSTPGSTTTVIPSAVLIAPFAFFATWVMARHGFRGLKKD